MSKLTNLCYLTTWFAIVVMASSAFSASAQDLLPRGSHPLALDTPHFPDRMHAFVWRNWQLVDPGRLAKVLGTTPENVTRIATSMGLPAATFVEPHMLDRGYISLVRRNWHLLPYDQLLQLLLESFHLPVVGFVIVPEAVEEPVNHQYLELGSE